MVALNLIATLGTFFSLYLVGSIPTGYWLCKYRFNIDITLLGSGNIGATNVARVLGDIRYFFLIFFIDATKALCALWLASKPLLSMYSKSPAENLLLLGAAVLFLGNVHSIFLRFNGGKGVATLVGLISYLLPLWLLLPFILVWLVVLFVTRTMYLASLSGAFVMVSVYWLYYFHPANLMAYLLALLFIFLVIRHKRNILDALRS